LEQLLKAGLKSKQRNSPPALRVRATGIRHPSTSSALWIRLFELSPQSRLALTIGRWCWHPSSGDAGEKSGTQRFRIENIAGDNDGFSAAALHRFPGTVESPSQSTCAPIAET